MAKIESGLPNELGGMYAVAIMRKWNGNITWHVCEWALGMWVLPYEVSEMDNEEFDILGWIKLEI